MVMRKQIIIKFRGYHYANNFRKPHHFLRNFNLIELLNEQLPRGVIKLLKVKSLLWIFKFIWLTTHLTTQFLGLI